MMKKRMIMMALVLSTITTGVFAQACPQANQLTAEQKAQMKEIKEKYAPEIAELRNEIKIASTQQKVLLSSKAIDEKAIYANIDKMGKLKAKMHKQTLTMRGEMKAINPSAKRSAKEKCHKGKGGNHKTCEANTAPEHRKAQAESNTKHDGCHQGKRQQRGDNCTKAMAHKDTKCQKGRLNLDDEQKEQIAKIKKAHFWNIQETQNQIDLLKAKNTTPEAQLKSIDKISTLQTTLAKQRMAVKLEIINVLTEEQRIQMITMHQGKEKGDKKGKHNHHQERG